MVNEEEFIDLKQRLQEAEATLQAIRQGEVDGLVVHGPQGDVLYSLVSPDDPYKVFIDNMNEGALLLSKEGIILYSNRGFSEIIGSPIESILGTSLADYVIDSQKSFFEQSLKNLNKKKFDCSFLTKKHGILNISISISKGLWKDSDNLCVLLTDVTPLKRAQRLVEASESISKILSETSTISVACQNIIDLLKHYLDWEVLIVWLWNKEKQVLNCVEIAHIQNINIEEFTQKTKELEIGIGSRIISNPVHVWNSCRPIWIEDITEDPSFIRREQAAKNGLRGCIAFPFFKESHLMGVIELFRRTPFNEHVDEQILNLITSIGIEVGIYIQRHIEEEGKIEFPIVLKYISNGILTVDKSGIIRSWNKAAEAIFGWSAQEMIGSSAKILFPPEKLHEFDEILNALIAGKSIEHFYTTRINKQGELVFVENSYGLITNPFGEFTSICVVVNDISMKKNYEKTIAQITDRFKNFISMTEEWIWEIDHLGHFIFSNSAIYKILGYTAEEVIGNNIVRFISFDNRKKIEDQLKMSTAQKEGWVHEIICFTNKNGKESWLDSNVSPLINESNQLIGFRGASRDITESLNLEKVKNEFISIVSHELKNPLASIYGALSLLKGKQLNPDQKNELLISAQRNSELLTNIINDITDVERLQLGKLNFNFKKIILNDVIHESIASSDILAHKSDVKIETIKSLPDVAVRGDYQRLMQVMINLLSNAIKFSPNQGTISVMEEILGNKVRVSVKDQGPGVPKEFEHKIFQKFAQADSSIKRSYGGTGLGLFICKNIIESLDGTIHFTSKMGEGTTFFFELPIYEKGMNE